MSMSEAPVIQGKTLGKFTLRGEPRDYYIQRPYRLQEIDYYKLTKTANKLETAAFALFTAAGFALIVGLSKLIALYVGGVLDVASNVKSWEFIAPGIAIPIGGALYWLGKLLPNDRRDLIKKIDDHFKANKSIEASMEE